MQIFERILAIILPVFIVIAGGYVYARFRGERVRSDMVAVNRLSVDVLSPMLVFSALAAKDFDLIHDAALVFAGVAISLGSALLALPVARLFGYQVRTFVPPMLYNNSGNMGLPLALLAFGPEGLSAAVAMFMAGTFVFFTAGIKLVESGRGYHTPVWKFMANPMMIAMIIGSLFSLLRLTVPAPLMQAMKMVGDAAIPLMLFALGVRMLGISLNTWRIGLVGAVACPVTGLIVAGLLDSVLDLTPMQRSQMYLFASLPPAVFCFMVAEQYKQEPDKVASIVLLGNLAALVFVPLGLWIAM